MILDHISNAALYTGAHPLFAQAFAYLASSADPVGSYDLAGEDLVAKVQAYLTRTEGKFEAHDRYIDIQYIVEGEEKMYYARRTGMTELSPMDPAKDAAFYADPVHCVEITARAGDFAIFFPDDAHKPCICVSEPSEVKKIVMKVRV